VIVMEQKVSLIRSFASAAKAASARGHIEQK
jgi:hypothetical protein